MNPSIAASVLALALFILAPQAAAQDRIASEAPVAAGVSVASDPAVRDAFARLDVWLDGQRYRFDWPGFAVGVVHDQQLLWSKGYGYADVAQRIPSTDQTLYRIASISKTFAATAVVQLAERGKLSLDDPVSRHLRWFAPRDATPANACAHQPSASPVCR